MLIKEERTGLNHSVRIEPIEDADFKRIDAQRYWFSWRKEKKFSIWKLTIEGTDDILGLMSLNFIEEEKRVEIRLLACSRENVGKGKIFSGIAGCLIAYACRQAILQYPDAPCVSLVPKTRLRQYYINRYGMIDAGLSLCLLEVGLINIITKYNL